LFPRQKEATSTKDCGVKGKGKGWYWVPVLQSRVQGQGKGKGKRGGLFDRTSMETVVWIGGFPEGLTGEDVNKALEEHINSLSSGCKSVSVGKRGQGSAQFGSVDEATSAIALLNGSFFQGCKLKFDAWTSKD
jgi:hypothetical protein